MTGTAHAAASRLECERWPAKWSRIESSRPPERAEHEPGADEDAAASAALTKPRDEQHERDEDHELGEREVAPGRRRALVGPRPPSPGQRPAHGGLVGAPAARGVALGPRGRSAGGGLDGHAALAASLTHPVSLLSGRRLHAAPPG